MAIAITPVTPDYTTQTGSGYPLDIDQGLASAQIVANQFQPHESAAGSPLAPDMTITIDAGVLYIGSVLTAKAQQITSSSPADFIAPVTNPRIDRVGINITTGNYEVTTGVEAASPVAPDYPADNNPLCQIALATSTTQIANSLITDERVGAVPIILSGTWTPTFQDASLSDAEGQAYSLQIGRYTRVGSRIFFTGQVTMTSLGTLNTLQQINIAGLPFTSQNTTNLRGVCNVALGDSLNISAGTNITGSIDPNTTYIKLGVWSAVTGDVTYDFANLTASGSLLFEGHYLA